MYVDKYATAIRNNPLMPEPHMLQISGTLGAGFIQIRNEAEEEGIEYGCNLYLIRDTVEVGRVRKGEQTSVDLGTTRQSKNELYVGDFHVHPYRRKMSSKATVGFSTGDIDSYLTTKTRRSYVRFHFVFAGTELWLIVMYRWTKTQGTGPIPKTFDTNVGLEYLEQVGGYKDWETAMSRKGGATTLTDKIQIERTLWKKYPKYQAIFSGANYDMNVEFARHYQYSLYVGQYPKRISAGACGLDLLRQ
jgi:hypothetical protein